MRTRRCACLPNFVHQNDTFDPVRSIDRPSTYPAIDVGHAGGRSSARANAGEMESHCWPTAGAAATAAFFRNRRLLPMGSDAAAVRTRSAVAADRRMPLLLLKGRGMMGRGAMDRHVVVGVVEKMIDRCVDSFQSQCIRSTCTHSSAFKLLATRGIRAASLD